MKIRVAWVAPVANWISIWLDKKDLAKHFGQSYVFEPVHFAGTPPMVTAIANNEVEIGDLAYSTLPIAIKNAGMDDIRIIADDFQDGVDDHWTIRYTVLTDGPIKKIEDLKGKVVATNAEGSAVDIAMKAMLHKHGLENKRDYTVIEAPFPAMKAMLAEHKVDLIPGILPFALDPEMAKIGTTLFTAKDAIGVSEFVTLPGAQAVHRQEPRCASSIGWKTPSASCTGTSTRRTTTKPCRSRPALSKRRRNGSAGSSPRPTNIAIRRCCRTSARCRRTST